MKSEIDPNFKIMYKKLIICTSHHQFLLPKWGTGQEIILLQRPLSRATMEVSAQDPSPNS